MERISEYADQIARLTTQRTEAEKKVELLDETLSLLEEAKDNLSNNYVSSVERSFVQYANTLLGDQIGKITLDNELQVRVEEFGEPRDIHYFSAGVTDCLMICMRLSLIDALFKQEKPFIILDDPFVNLDDLHTQRALEMLECIAKTHQVIYLVCNTSRIQST